MNDGINFPKTTWEEDHVMNWLERVLDGIEGVSLLKPGDPIEDLSGFYRVPIQLHRPDLTVEDLFHV